MAQPRSKMLLKEIWVPAEHTFTFKESQDPTTGERKYILKGLMLPFGKISRNNVLYNKESVLQKHKELIGRPVMYNHQTEGHSLPVGHFIESNCDENAWTYAADIDPHEKDIIRKLERGDLRHVSIQLIGGKVVERYREGTGDVYTEAYVSDIIEGSIVPAPGFLDTTAMLAEAFKGKEYAQAGDQPDIVGKEDMTLGTAGGAVGKSLLPGAGTHKEGEPSSPGEFPWDAFKTGLAKEASEHGELPILEIAQIVIDHLKGNPDEYDAPKPTDEEMESLAEHYIDSVGEPEVSRLIKENRV